MQQDAGKSGRRSKFGGRGEGAVGGAGVRPVAMTVAGSDSSAGAGLQADLKTFLSLGVYGLCAVTCVVAEHPGEVVSIQAVRPDILEDQLRLNLEAFPVAAAKTGMLYSARLIAVTASAFERMRRRPALVVDPVMVATSGARLLKTDAVACLCERLLPLASLVTPNLDEAAALAGERLPNLAAMREAAHSLRKRFGCAVLIKGGHLRGKVAADVLADGRDVTVFETAFVRGVQTHGTGCTLSAAITAGLARGLSLAAAVQAAKAFVTRAIASSRRFGAWQMLNHAV